MPGQVIRVPFRDSSDDDAEQVTTIHILNDYSGQEAFNTRSNRSPFGVELSQQQRRSAVPHSTLPSQSTSAPSGATTAEQPSRFRQFCNRVAGSIANSITKGMTNDIIQQSNLMLSPRHDMFDDESSTEARDNSFCSNNNNNITTTTYNNTLEENSEREWAVDTEHEHNVHYDDDDSNRWVHLNSNTTNSNVPVGGNQPNVVASNFNYGEAPVMTTNVPYELHNVSEANPCNYEAAQSVTNTEDENVDIDLRETIQQYVETGLDFYYNIILVTLKYNTRPITSEVFSAARGNPLLIMTLLNIGTVDENDPIVREIVQEEVDRIVDVGKPVCTPTSECSSNDLNSEEEPLHHHLHGSNNNNNNNNSSNNNAISNFNNMCNTTAASNDLSNVVNVATHHEFVSAKHVEYLRALCQVKTVRLTLRQIALLRFSGFEYIKILTDYPYLWKDVPRPSLAMSAAMRVMLLIRFIVSWMGILASMVFLGATVWVITFWFRQSGQSENGYWTILCWVVAYVMSIIWTARVEEDKIVQYDEQIWSYPDYKFKFIPAIPAYDFLLLMTALRYKLQRDTKRYLVIDYDLRNGIGLQQIIHGLFTVAPQVVLQLYLLTRGNNSTISGFPYPFRLLIASGIICYCFSLFSFLVIVTSAHSCTTFGFARMTISELQGRRQWLLVTHILTRELHFFLVYFSVVVCVSLFIFLLNTTDCSASDKTILSVYIGVVVICDVVLVYILIYKPPARVYGIIALPVIAMEIARLVYAKVQSRNDPFHFRRCLLVDRVDTVWTIPIFVTFGGLCVSYLLWSAAVLYELITKKEIKQRLADNLLFLWI